MPPESIRIAWGVKRMKIHARIQQQGREARLNGKPLEDNPYRFFGGKGKEHKQAAWATGWHKAKEERT